MPGSTPPTWWAEPGEGWRLAMTVVSHEREPGELGYVARYGKLVNELVRLVGQDPGAVGPRRVRELAWALVEVEMLGCHVSRRLSERLEGISHGPEGSVDKLLMTWTEQTVGHAALGVGGVLASGGDDDPPQGLPLQSGPERHGRHFADPAHPRRHPDPRAPHPMRTDPPRSRT